MGFIGTGSGGDESTGGSNGKDASTVGAGPSSVDDCGSSNPAGLSAGDVQKLQAGSGSAGGLRILSPYDGTVFPRGLIAPLLMWDGGNADAVYVHIRSSAFEYKGCLKPTASGQVQLPQAAWDQVAAAAKGAKDPYALELTTWSGGAATGPVSEKIIVAQATLKGSIFYNTYKSKLVTPTDIIGVVTGGQGAVLRIVPGKKAEAFLGQTQCTGCHSVSASGNRLIANPNPLSGAVGGASYALTAGMAPNPTPQVANLTNGSFVGISPDGALAITNAHPGGAGPRAGAPGASGDPSAQLVDTTTGTTIPGANIPAGAMMTTFSPDGSLIAFTDYAIKNGQGLALMSFDEKSRTASNYKQLYQTPDNTYSGWPFFLPNTKGIVFANGSANDYSGMATGLLGPLVGASSDLFILDVGTGSATLLANAIGFASPADATSGKTYLPYGAEELHHNFYPTVSPVAAGGYFWIFFDSYRHYGNTHSGGLVRQLWGSAIDISVDGSYKTDPSHPPFYLTGQEDVEGNHRAFAALDPCRNDGSDCTTGIDCCVGFCTNGKCGAPPVEMGPVCAHTDERCSNGTPCCDKADKCLGGYCGQIVIQ